MKKKIAIFATGWSEEILSEYVKGIYEELSALNADTYLFMGYPTLGDTPDFVRGELNIFDLPDMNDFDGACVMGNSIDYPEVLDRINARLEAAGVPVVYTGKNDGVHHYVGADNYVGARELGDYLIEQHGITDIFVIAGSPDNEDSNDRLQAVRDAMQAHGLELTEDKIYYSNWDLRKIKNLLEDWNIPENKLPQAFVCANDKLAMVLCKELLAYGIKVPEDVFVTGFDNEFYARVYDPSISTVDQNFNLIGRKSAQTLIRLMNGEEAELSVKVPCEFVPSESCGCTGSRDFDAMRREVGKNAFLENVYVSAFQRKLSIMEKGIMQGHKYSDLRSNLKWINNTFNNFEGDTYHILLDPLFEETIINPNMQLRETGYAPVMDVVYSMDEGEYRSVEEFDTAKIVPFVKNENRNHLFICLPLQDSGRSMGYVVFADDFAKLRNSQDTQVYMERLSVILSKFHQSISIDVLNQKLLELSETDALTHVKNRTAYQARLRMIEKRISTDNPEPCAVVICDLNSLKKINDNYGHEMGDKYIVNCCSLICKIFKHSVVYRIGGDEFAIILEGDSFEERRSLLNEMELEMQRSCDSKAPVWERISIAYGMADYNRETDANFIDVINRADGEMYIRKVAMKS